MVPRLFCTMLAITLLSTHGAQADPSIEWNDMLVKTLADPSMGWDPEYAAYAAAPCRIATETSGEQPALNATLAF